jgi:hypothetical protein
MQMWFRKSSGFCWAVVQFTDPQRDIDIGFQEIQQAVRENQLY